MSELNVGDTAAKEATAKLEADVQKGSLDAPAAADATARTVASTAGAAGGAAACSAIGAAPAAPLCAAIGGEIAGAVYDVGKKVIDGLFGSESSADKAARYLRNARRALHETEKQFNAARSEALNAVAAIIAQVRQTQQQLGVQLFETQDDLILEIANYGVPYRLRMTRLPSDPGECLPLDTPYVDGITGKTVPGPGLEIAIPGGCELEAKFYREDQALQKELDRLKGKQHNDWFRKHNADVKRVAYRDAVQQMLPIIDKLRNATLLLLTDLTVRVEVAKAVRRRSPPKLAPITRPKPARRPPALAPVAPPKKPPAPAPAAPPAAPRPAQAAPHAPGAVTYGPYPQRPSR